MPDEDQDVQQDEHGAAAPADPVPVDIPATDSIVEQWFDSHIRGSVATGSTVVWNHLQFAKERLKEMLRS